MIKVHKQDHIRLIVALILFSAISISYYFEGKSTFTKIVVVVAFIGWLITLWLLRKYYNNK